MWRRWKAKKSQWLLRLLWLLPLLRRLLPVVCTRRRPDVYDWLTAKPRHRGLTSRFLLTTFTSKLKPPAPYRKDVEHELICVGVLVSACWKCI